MNFVPLPTHPPTKLKDTLLSSQVIFHEPRNQGLKHPEAVEPEKWATHLAYLSAREPANLINHVRRVYLHLARKQPDALYGAMLDLYLILGDKGASLRKRLLKMSKRDLPRDQYVFFATHWKQGLRDNQSFPISQHSVLGNFVQGELGLVNEGLLNEPKGAKKMDPLELAKEELTFGDVTVAQEILESAILETPTRMGLHYSLLEVYKHSRSLTDLQKMQDELGEHVSIAQSAWKQTRHYLESLGS
ncbi:MAG: hypothetical protein ABW139_16640 [Candidatus Thiodiazotropha sp. DIVDIV]